MAPEPELEPGVQDHMLVDQRTPGIAGDSEGGSGLHHPVTVPVDGTQLVLPPESADTVAAAKQDKKERKRNKRTKGVAVPNTESHLSARRRAAPDLRLSREERARLAANPVPGAAPGRPAVQRAPTPIADGGRGRGGRNFNNRDNARDWGRDWGPAPDQRHRQRSPQRRHHDNSRSPPRPRERTPPRRSPARDDNAAVIEFGNGIRITIPQARR